ncbi:unnamed protein product [Porites lobata]|uniref:Uncharacterized protein n=1 Tax=Porites lobata TaxID=104759 RepID=A0ABN8RU41_9CNID|nr:unnamed protein product [Porites lobata]
MFVSGHSSEQSISHYSARPSAPQLESVSDTISNALQYNQTQSTQISTVSSTPSATPLIESLNRMASSVPTRLSARGPLFCSYHILTSSVIYN